MDAYAAYGISGEINGGQHATSHGMGVMFATGGLAMSEHPPLNGSLLHVSSVAPSDNKVFVPDAQVQRQRKQTMSLTIPLKFLQLNSNSGSTLLYNNFEIESVI